MNGLGRYEFIGGNSRKFWEIRKVNADLYIATWGRIGSDGRETQYTAAQACKKINEKVSKGYQLVTSYASYKVIEKKAEPRKPKRIANSLAQRFKKDLEKIS